MYMKGIAIGESWQWNGKVMELMKKLEELVQWDKTVMIRVCIRNLQLYGHICRMPDDWLLKTLMLEMVEGA